MHAGERTSDIPYPLQSEPFRSLPPSAIPTEYLQNSSTSLLRIQTGPWRRISTRQAVKSPTKEVYQHMAIRASIAKNLPPPISLRFPACTSVTCVRNTAAEPLRTAPDYKRPSHVSSTDLPLFCHGHYRARRVTARRISSECGHDKRLVRGPCIAGSLNIYVCLWIRWSVLRPRQLCHLLWNVSIRASSTMSSDEKVQNLCNRMPPWT